GNEAAYFVAGIDEDGYREVLSFQIGENESSTDLSGIKDIVTEAYPKADYQQCVAHKTRNTGSNVRENHKDDLLRDLKRVL
ncbi:transposase, partial [Candidatus Bipolaricaulota bacterium]|nr:transposase [Candidatus Bipolaricaulota bacterium]